MRLFKPNIEKMESEEDIKGLVDAIGYKKGIEWHIKVKNAIFRIANKDVSPLIKELKSKNLETRKIIILFLGEIKDQRAVNPLIELLQHDEDDFVRMEAAKALGRIGDPRAVKPLENVLEGETMHKSWLKQEATKALREIEAGPPNVEKLKSKQDVPGLIKALTFKRDSTVRKAAARALGELENNEAVEPLIGALEDKDKEVRMYAAGALDAIGDTLAVEPLIERLCTKGESYRVQLMSVIALGNLGDKKAIFPLIQALKVPDCNFRSAAAESLGKIGDDKSVGPLLVALKDEDSFVRRLSARALGEIGVFAAEPALKHLLENEVDQKVREEAKKALVKIGQAEETSQTIVEDITFKGKDQKGANTYEVYEAKDPESARRFLINKKVDKPLYHINVETSEGVWGKDKEGIYLVHLLPWQEVLELAQCEGEMVELPKNFSIQTYVEGITDNFITKIRCGVCGNEWLDGLRYQNVTVVKCPKCKAHNKVNTKYFHYIQE